MTDIIFRLEQASDDVAIEKMVAKVFPNKSPERAVSILRKNDNWKKEYCFVADEDGDIVGSIRFFYVLLPSGKQVIMLGPLSVSENNRGKGIGQTLVEHGLHALAGREDGVLIIGVEDYYDVYGFETEAVKKLKLKGEINPLALMGLEFEDEIFSNEKGFIISM